jgi:hypothetical protein
MNPLDTYKDTARRARLFLSYHDGLVPAHTRSIPIGWGASFSQLMGWSSSSGIQRVDCKEAVIVLRQGAGLNPNQFTRSCLDDQLRAALTFGVSALDRYVHERVVKGIVAALKKPNPNKEQREFVIPVSTAIKISAESVKAAKENKRLRPTNIIRKQVQVLLHKKPFQSYREIEYAFKLLGINNLSGQLQTAYGTGDLRAVKIQLANIAKRRNQIVHEGDLVVHERGGQVKWHVIERKYVADSLDFLDLFVAHLDSVV